MRWIFVSLLAVVGCGGRLPPEAEGITCAVRDVSNTCALKADGSVWCWGSNAVGELGDGTMQDRPSATRVALDGSVAHISASRTHACAVKTDGTLWCWGANAVGELGVGTSSPKSIPVQVVSLGNEALEVAAGPGGTCARTRDDSIWCWGENSTGAIGDGTTEDRYIPVRVTALATGVQISMGEAHTCARKTDGTVWCWGYNSSGQVGDLQLPIKNVLPVQVTAVGDNVADVVAGAHRTCARKTDGTIWCWGQRWLGEASFDAGRGVVELTSLGANVTEVSLGDQHACARKADTTVWCWGENVYGQLGDGTRQTTATPVRAALGAVGHITATTDGASCARKLNGTVWCWGLNHASPVA